MYMKFDIKYKDLKPMQVRDNYLRGKTWGKCWHCGAPTQFIEINYEAHLCSEECEQAKDEEINEACKRFSRDKRFD